MAIFNSYFDITRGYNETAKNQTRHDARTGAISYPQVPARAGPHQQHLDAVQRCGPELAPAELIGAESYHQEVTKGVSPMTGVILMLV
jgi:hypothetical protein